MKGLLASTAWWTLAILCATFLMFLQNAKTQSRGAEGEIEKVLTTQAAAWNKGDIDGYMEGYWKSDSLLFTSGGNIRRGWKETLEKYRHAYPNRAAMGTLKFSRLEITLLSADAAWVFGRWELRRSPDNPHGVFTLILRKFPSGWKITHDHTSLETTTSSQ